MDRFITNYENITLWQMARASLPKVAKFVVKENYKNHKSVRDIMIKKLVYSIIFAGLLLGLSTTSLFAQNQEQSDYYYQGYTFEQTNSVKSASPYLTVVMIGGENTTPKAVTMSNAIGEIYRSRARL